MNPTPAPVAVPAPISHPVIDRPDAGIVAVTEFPTGTAERQQALLDASAAAWTGLEWPRTMLSLTWLTSLDGAKAVAYVQWESDAEFAAYARTHRPVLTERLRAALPGVDLVPPTFYRRYRSGKRPDTPVPGCIVIVSVTFDGPDDARQRAWTDAVFEALAADPAPPPGGISGHFHISTDGTRVLNYAEWVDAESHRAALERSGQGSIGSGPAWRRVHAFPGVASSDVTRYRIARSIGRG
jgi:hypothetical protein